MTMWVDELVWQYSDGKKKLEAYHASLDREDPVAKEEVPIVGGMISDMQYALEWMQRGRRPGSRRGIDKRSVYQRTELMDMDLFSNLDVKPAASSLTNEQKRKLVEILLLLSLRERHCYMLHMSYGLTYADIAEELNLSRNTVRTFVDRAKEKIKNHTACHSNVI